MMHQPHSSVVHHSFLLLLLASVLWTNDAAANDISVRRLRQGHEIRQSGFGLICGNETCNTTRFQPRNKINGHSYYIKKSNLQQIPDEKSQPQLRKPVERKIDVRRNRTAKSQKENHFNLIKMKQDWKSLLTKARKSIARRI